MNKTIEWIMGNVPEPKHEGRYYSYAFVFEQAYGFKTSGMGVRVRRDIEDYTALNLFQRGVAVQLGVQSHGTRGIRIINLQ